MIRDVRTLLDGYEEIQGIVSHGRSVLVWPELAGPVSDGLVKQLITKRVPFIVLGPRSAVGISNVVCHPLTILAVRREGPEMSGNDVQCIESVHLEGGEVEKIWALHDRCGIKRLPDNIYQSPSWTHQILWENHSIIATASLQFLPIDWAGQYRRVSLLCGVAVMPERQGAGLGRRIVERTTGVTRTDVFAFTEKDSSTLFFRSLGWDRAGKAWYVPAAE